MGHGFLRVDEPEPCLDPGQPVPAVEDLGLEFGLPQPQHRVGHR